jgi:hypothetical protein
MIQCCSSLVSLADSPIRRSTDVECCVVFNLDFQFLAQRCSDLFERREGMWSSLPIRTVRMLLLRRNAYLWLRRCGEVARQEVSQPCILTPAMGQTRVSSFILSCLCFRMSNKISISHISCRSHISYKFHPVHLVFSSKIPWFPRLLTRSCLTGG